MSSPRAVVSASPRSAHGDWQSLSPTRRQSVATPCTESPSPHHSASTVASYSCFFSSEFEALGVRADAAGGHFNCARPSGAPRAPTVVGWVGDRVTCPLPASLEFCACLSSYPAQHQVGRGSVVLCLHSTIVPVCLQGGKQLIGHKTWPSTQVEEIARLLCDDGACPHSVWFRSR